MNFTDYVPKLTPLAHFEKKKRTLLFFGHVINLGILTQNQCILTTRTKDVAFVFLYKYITMIVNQPSGGN